jgi:hypothetical protein
MKKWRNEKNEFLLLFCRSGHFFVGPLSKNPNKAINQRKNPERINLAKTPLQFIKLSNFPVHHKHFHLLRILYRYRLKTSFTIPEVQLHKANCFP